MSKQGPYILDSENRPILAIRSGQSYESWVRSLQASEEWRWGGRSFETIFTKNDWLPDGQGSLVTMFEPYAIVDSIGPRVFHTYMTIGPVKDNAFVSTGNRIVLMATYHTRESAIAGHVEILEAVSRDGLDAVIQKGMGQP